MTKNYDEMSIVKFQKSFKQKKSAIKDSLSSLGQIGFYVQDAGGNSITAGETSVSM